MLFQQSRGQCICGQSLLLGCLPQSLLQFRSQGQRNGHQEHPPNGKTLSGLGVSDSIEILKASGILTDWPKRGNSQAFPTGHGRVGPVDFRVDVAGKPVRLFVADITTDELMRVNHDPSQLPRGCRRRRLPLGQAGSVTELHGNAPAWTHSRPGRIRCVLVGLWQRLSYGFRAQRELGFDGQAWRASSAAQAWSGSDRGGLGVPS